MKKIYWFIIIGVVVVVALGVGAGVALAQSPTRDPGDYPFWGGGMMGGGRGGHMGGGMMGGYYSDGSTYGFMHDDMIAALADGLGMTTEELQARLDAGETLYQIADEQGLTQDEWFTLVDQARETALDNAVAEGIFTEEQAQWMEERMDQRGAGFCWGLDLEP